MPIPSREKLVKIVWACLPAKQEEDAVEFLKSRICYGPKLPACKRCSHTICPCCYPTVNWCDLCLSKGDISGTVDSVEELKSLDIRSIPELAHMFKLSEEVICIQSLDSGMVYMHVDADYGGRIPSPIPGYYWSEGWHPGCEDNGTCDFTIWPGFEEEFDDWLERAKLLTSKSVYYTCDVEDRVVACSEEAWKEVLDLVGLPDRNVKKPKESPYHRALYYARSARKSSRKAHGDNYESNASILKLGTEALQENLKPLASMRFVQLLAHGALEEPNLVERVWEAEDVKKAIEALEVEQ